MKYYMIKKLSGGIDPSSYKMKVSEKNPNLQYYLNNPSIFKVIEVR
jgi:hypothetical protein